MLIYVAIQHSFILYLPLLAFGILTYFARSFLHFVSVASKLTNFHDLLLEYAFTMYPLFLVIITYIGIELHARNVRPIVILWKPFYKLFHIRRSLDPRSSVIATFSTFISLSFSKLMFITFVITYPSLLGKTVQ